MSLNIVKWTKRVAELDIEILFESIKQRKKPGRLDALKNERQKNYKKVSAKIGTKKANLLYQRIRNIVA